MATRKSTSPARSKSQEAAPARPPRVLMIDIGGSNVKVMASGQPEMRKRPSAREMTAEQMVAEVKEMTKDWEFDVVTLGFPGLVRNGTLVREPLNLGGRWLGYDFELAFGRPVRIINDAALQALAVYQGGRMLFVGLGTSIGAALVADGVIVPVELGLVPLKSGDPFMVRLTKDARKRDGNRRWVKASIQAIELLRDVFWPDDTVIGGGNGKFIEPLPEGCRRSDNQTAFVGATRLWEGADMLARPVGTTWRIDVTPAQERARPE
ncbi:MAG TPA: ROK family protein [Chthoniobacteraceae bacterium]|nr:ROK family protein [Chthoniobacteraceae bacterium]